MELPKFTFTIKVGEQSIANDLQKELIVGDDNIDTHLDETPSRMLYWTSLEDCQANELKKKKDEFRVWLAVEKEKCTAGKKYTSEMAKEDAVILATKEKYLEWINTISDMEYNLNLLKSVSEAWKAKKELLVSLSANLRSEFEKGLRIKEWNEQQKKKIEKAVQAV